MANTKKNILQSAIFLFNTYGLVNVRLQQIADETGISVGNLAYHYYSKKAVVIAIDNQLEGEITPLLHLESDFPYLIDFDNHLSNYYNLIKQFSFYFLDVLELERAYPKLHEKRKVYIEQMISQIKKWLDINVEKGLFKSELQENHYYYTSSTIWLIITFWLTQKKVRGVDDDNEGLFKEAVWNQLLPLFTDSGFLEYEAIILPQLKYY